MDSNGLPMGKLPVELLSEILKKAPLFDPRVISGPGVGRDCAVVDLGTTVLVFKSDPITLTSEEIGWYAVQINANDIAVTGAAPRWFLATLLLPEHGSTPERVRAIAARTFDACREMGISVIGGHTEVTHGLDRPILSGTMIGEARRDRLVLSQGAQPGDRILLTKSVPIEGMAILAREFPQKLVPYLRLEEISQAAGYIHRPGISVLKDARLALEAGEIHAMHDPTEGGVAGALWEMAEASGTSFFVDARFIPVSDLSRRICSIFGIDPLATIASGALLIACPLTSLHPVCETLRRNRIDCTEIGRVEAGEARLMTLVDGQYALWPRPERDEIARVYEDSENPA